ncbi:MAG TPA: hypothetical protein VGN86_18460 [Pyrinomonadaceae bacterium]|jgi:hypothetical protein|nr:hypothetical protein [Pyrinomonadaceae bacterium]
MFTSLNLTPENLEELPAKSSLPWVWFGFFFVAAFVIEETVMIALELDQLVSTGILTLIAIAGWIYWLFCVSRFHKILGEISRNQYPIGSAEAAWKHIIPFYNLVWVFRWPTAMSDYLNRRERVKMVSGTGLGVVLLLSLLLGRLFDSAVGLAGTFIVGMYISAKLRKHVELIGASRNMSPPLPDPSLFNRTPAADQKGSQTETFSSLPSQ